MCLVAGFQLPIYPTTKSDAPTPGYQKTTWRLPGDYLVGPSAFRGNALFGYFRRILGVFHRAPQSFLSLYTASILLIFDFLFFYANFLYMATMRFCLSIMAILALMAILTIGDSGLVATLLFSVPQCLRGRFALYTQSQFRQNLSWKLNLSSSSILARNTRS